MMVMVMNLRYINNSGKQTTSPARQKVGRRIEYIKYEQKGRTFQLKEMFREG